MCMYIALVFVNDTAYSEATLEAALLCFKYHKESNTTYQERLQLLSYVQQLCMHVQLLLVLQERQRAVGESSEEP